MGIRRLASKSLLKAPAGLGESDAYGIEPLKTNLIS